MGWRGYVPPSLYVKRDPELTQIHKFQYSEHCLVLLHTFAVFSIRVSLFEITLRYEKCIDNKGIKLIVLKTSSLRHLDFTKLEL